MYNYNTIDTDRFLNAAFRELLPVARDWFNIGILLNMYHPVLQRIERDVSGVNDCLREMLAEWTKQNDPPPSWDLLADAVHPFNPLKARSIQESYVSASKLSPPTS